MIVTRWQHCLFNKTILKSTRLIQFFLLLLPVASLKAQSGNIEFIENKGFKTCSVNNLDYQKVDLFSGEIIFSTEKPEEKKLLWSRMPECQWP